MEITGLQNPVVKAAAELKQKKYRQQQGLFLAEGLRTVEEAATTRLGLVKADPSQITYVQLEDQSIIERNTGAAGRLLDEVRTAALSLLDSLNP